MATAPVTQPTLAQVAAQAQQLFAELQAKGVNASDPKSIVESAKSLLGLLDGLQPHLNKAQSAFGGQDANVTKINNLRNQINKVIATYSS